MNTCTDCGRTMVGKRAWSALTELERADLRKTHTRVGVFFRGLCEACLVYRKRGHLTDRRTVTEPPTDELVADYDPAELEYLGGWTRRGLVLVPTRTEQP